MIFKIAYIYPSGLVPMVEHLEAVLKVSEKFSIFGGHKTLPTQHTHTVMMLTCTKNL